MYALGSVEWAPFVPMCVRRWQVIRLPYLLTHSLFCELWDFPHLERRGKAHLIRNNKLSATASWAMVWVSAWPLQNLQRTQDEQRNEKHRMAVCWDRSANKGPLLWDMSTGVKVTVLAAYSGQDSEPKELERKPSKYVRLPFIFVSRKKHERISSDPCTDQSNHLG